jgi:hypothetical protein
MDDDAATRRIVNQAKKPDLVKGDAAYCAYAASIAGVSPVGVRLFGNACAGETMQHRTAAKRAIVLALPAHRRPKMLVRRQADAVEIVVALAAGSNGTSESRPRTRPVLPANYYNLLDAQASIQDDSDAFEARWRARFLEAIEK